MADNIVKPNDCTMQTESETVEGDRISTFSQVGTISMTVWSGTCSRRAERPTKSGRNAG